MTEYVEASPAARQLFFLTVLLLVGALGITMQWSEHAEPRERDDRTSDEIFQDAIETSYRVAIYETIFMAPILALTLWFGTNLVSQRRWPFEGVPVPFRVKVTRYKRWQAILLSILMISGPVVLTVLAWQKHKDRSAYFSELADEIDGPYKAAQPSAAPDA